MLVSLLRVSVRRGPRFEATIFHMIDPALSSSLNKFKC